MSFAIRLVTSRYISHIEWEDGPGSLQNVVSDKRSWSQRLGTMTVEAAQALTKSDLEHEYGCYFEEDSADGIEEYSFKLEYLDPSGAWRLVKILW